MTVLENRKILISQPKPGGAEKSPIQELADKYDIQMEFRPFCRIEGVSIKEFRAKRIDILAHGAVFLTSKTAADHYFRICSEMRVVVPDTMKYFCLGESIANYLQKYIVYRKRKIFFAPKLDELITMMTKHKDVQILLPLSEPHKPEIPRMLDRKKFKNTKVVLYRSVYSDLSDIKIKDYDVLVYYSPTEIKSLKDNFPDFEQGDTVIACFGPATVKAAKEAQLRVDIAAPSAQFPSMTMALEHFLKIHANKEA